MSVFIIAEASVNHQGDYEIAEGLVRSAMDAGADAVKFQLFKDRPAIEHLRFTEEEIEGLHLYCQDRRIQFMCTPFYPEAVAFLDPLVKRHKLASGYLKNRTMLDAVCATAKPVIASTGMTIPYQIAEAVSGRANISLLHCVSSYPCPDEDANILAMDGLRKFGFPVGYSDHTVGTLACVAAVARGAQIIEKHITFDKTAEGPDHACSAEPEEFAEMVRKIRRLERML